MTHMPTKFARRVDVGSACVDIRQSPKTDVLVIYSFGAVDRNLNHWHKGAGVTVSIGCVSNTFSVKNILG